MTGSESTKASDPAGDQLSEIKPANNNSDAFQLPPLGVFSLKHFVEVMKMWLAMPPGHVPRPLTSTERLVAYALVLYFERAIEAGELFEEDPMEDPYIFTGVDARRFLRLLPREIDNAWTYLRTSADFDAQAFRNNYKQSCGREPTDLVAIGGGIARIQDAALVLSVVAKIGNSVLLPDLFRAHVSQEQEVLLTRFRDFLKYVYVPMTRGRVIEPGFQERTFRAWGARMQMKQHGTQVTFTFRCGRLSKRRVVFTGKMDDMRGENFAVASFGITLDSAIALVRVVVDKYGQPFVLNFDTPDFVHLRTLFPEQK